MDLKKRALSLIPLDRILRWYLRHKDKEYLLRFIDGMAHIGQPSQVFFPPELFEQGASLLLSGLNNTLAIQSNPNWVWPYWVERQQDPEGDDFVPTGVNLVLGNLTHRNWTSIGIKGSRLEAMVDPVGMTTIEPFGWSVMPFVRYQDQLALPPRLAEQSQQKLGPDQIPVVVTSYNCFKDLEWSFEAQALLTQGEELVCFAQRFTNRSKQTLRFTAGFALRPYNALTIGHINKIKYKNQLWRINRRPALWLPRPPDRSFAAGGTEPDPLLGQTQVPQVSKLRSLSGLLAGQSEYDLTLKPGETLVLRAAAPMARHGALEKRFEHLSEAALAQAVDRSVDFWQLSQRRGMNLTVPRHDLQEAFGAVKNHLHVFDDGDRFTAGTYFYHFEWLRDSAFLALAFENLGFSKEVAQKVPGFLKFQDKEGCFKSQDGEWDGPGQAMVTLIRHFTRAGDDESLKRYFSKLYKSAQWIEKTRQLSANGPAPHGGLLPAGLSAEHFGPNDHYFWDNFWGLAGMMALLDVARRLNLRTETAWLEDASGRYRERIFQVAAQASSKAPEGGLPCSIYRHLDTAAIGNLVALWPLDLISPFESWVGPTVEFLYRNNLKQGLFYQQIIHTGLNAYLSVQFAQVLLARGDERVWEVIEALLKMGGPTYVWPEAIHPKSHGGCMGDGDHGWAAAEFANLMRCLLVKEQQGELLFGLGLQADWLSEGAKISIHEAPTDFGLVHWDLTCKQELMTLTWSIQRGPLQTRASAYLMLPRGLVKGPHWGQNKTRIALEGEQGQLTLLRADGLAAPLQSKTA
ncbi:MAG: hypothetical protein RRB13_12130 [bacterium]|nr:hypothetical protein [bacterium]